MLGKYPLVISHMASWKIGKSLINSPFSIAIFDDQRVDWELSMGFCEISQDLMGFRWDFDGVSMGYGILMRCFHGILIGYLWAFKWDLNGT